MSLFERLGGSENIVTLVNDLYPRLRSDAKIGRFWNHRGNDGLKKEMALMAEYLSFAAGGPVQYQGRDMELTHKGMRIDREDWKNFMQCFKQSLSTIKCDETAKDEFYKFIESICTGLIEQTGGNS